ncbi:MAG: hypothetical protein E7Z68_08175 [Thermoplasmata archaeon]|nr:hypothetical protein [Thermoplasmata archaeon]
MIFVSLRDRLNPPQPVNEFVRDRTTTGFKNQILNIIHRHYYSQHYDSMAFSISSYSHEIVQTYATSKSLEPLGPNKVYNENAVYEILKKSEDYAFFEFLDCVIFTLYSDPHIRYLPSFNEFISDLNESMKLHGVDYVIIEGHLEYRIEETIFESAVKPCLSILQRQGLCDADKYLLDSFQSYKQGNNNEAIEFAVKSLENVVQYILDVNKIDYDPKDMKLQNRIPLIMKGSNSEFLSKKMSGQYIQMEKIFQVAMSSRNEVTHGSKSFEADDSLVEHTINIVAADILFLMKTCLKN